jgi:N-methylhydantoinase A/oxoprolinase/acetone carboxylase beta subunit
MTRYAIGIDTGGTYTDAALIDAGARTVLAKAKALTTKGDLSIGVTEALDKVLDAAGSDAGANGHGVAGEDIALVSLSTTLATNAIVEGHGSAIGVILVGFDDKMAERTEIARAIPGARVLRVSGGHDHGGSEAEKLDEPAVAAFLRETGGAVEAYAVASHYSVRNPAHEQRVRALAAELTGRPTTLSSDLAHALDAPRRALTAALNARIIARIVALVAAVRLSMHRHGVDAPLMIVKGDGTLADADAVAQRPIETILSGPAASVIGAKFLSGLADFVISDIGGTTTDVAVLENGWPRLDRSGAIVGGRRTLVRAIDMRTFGLGGDSEVDFENDGRVVLRTNRIVPASLLASRHPSVLRHMRKVLADPEGEPYAGRFLVRPFGHDGGAVAADLSGRERDMLDLVQGEPIPMKDAVKGPSNHRALDRLVGLGLLQVSGFTPSDAAHVLGLQGQWLREGAVLAGALFKRWRRMSPSLDAGNAEAFAREFAADVIDAVVAKTGRVILETLAGGPLDGAAAPLVEAVVSGAGKLRGLSVAIGPVSPVVAVGGPAGVYYPQVGERLGCAIVLPEHGDVANAVGAAVGVVKAQAVVEISSQGMGAWRIHADGEPIPVADPGEALARARAMAEEAARAGALAMGATHPIVEVHIDRVDLPDMQGDRGLIAATIIAESWGAPKAVEDEDAVEPGLA